MGIGDLVGLLDGQLDAVSGGSVARRLCRAGVEEVVGRRVREIDFDRLVMTQIAVVGSALRRSGLIDGELHLLSSKDGTTQFENIDVLAVDVVEGHPRRLVMFEDKLIKNPESRRKVLAQALDYACRIEGPDVRADTLLDWLCPEDRDLLSEQLGEDGIDDLLAQDPVLVIAGDEIRDSAAQLTRWLADRIDPISGLKLALMELALFQLPGDGFLFVPSVVGRSVDAVRTMRIIVETPEGVVARSAPVSSKEARAAGLASVEDLYSAIGDARDARHASAARRLIEYAITLGARVTFTKGSVKMVIEAGGGTVPLFYVTRGGRFCLDGLGAWERADASDALRRYVSALTELFGQTVDGHWHRGAGEPASLVRVLDNLEAVERVLHRTVDELRAQPVDA